MQVTDYLQAYAEHFQLLDNINLKTMVTSVKRLPFNFAACRGDSKCDVNDIKLHRPKWQVVTRNLQTKDTIEEVFDAVLICTGHFNDPNFPDIPGLNNFDGTLLHSHDYRKPEIYAGNCILEKDVITM